MSVSTLNATTGSMAAAAAIMQAHAVQYANHFANLQNAVGSGDLKEAKQALSVFQRDSATAAANGYDPVSQTLASRRDFSALKKALNVGDIRTAQAALSMLKKDMGLEESGLGTRGSIKADVQLLSTAIQAGDVASAKAALGSFGKKLALSTSQEGGVSGPLDSGSKVIQDIRALQIALSSRDKQQISNTFIKLEPELTSFSQAPQVFPTSGDSTLKPSVSTSAQLLIQGIGSTLPGAQSKDSAGTSFAPTPALILGTKGMTIPTGADLPISHDLILLKGLSLGL